MPHPPPSYMTEEEFFDFVQTRDTNNRCVLLHYRDGEGWGETMYDAADNVIQLKEIGAKLALRDVYYGLEFKPRRVTAIRSPVSVTITEPSITFD